MVLKRVIFRPVLRLFFFNFFNKVEGIQKKQRRPNMENEMLKSSAFTRISFNHDLMLSHHMAQRIHKRFFDTVDHALFVSTKVLRAQKRDDEARQIEDAARALCDKVETGIKAATERIDKRLLDAGVPSIQGHSDKSIAIKAEFSTGVSLRILDLLSRLDNLFLKIEALEAFNACSPTESSQLLRFWSSEFRHFLTALLVVRHKLPTPSKVETDHGNHD